MNINLTGCNSLPYVNRYGVINMYRKKAEAAAIQALNMVDKSGRSAKEFERLLKDLSDEQFIELINAIEERKYYVPIILDNLTNHGVTIENNLAVAEKLGYNFFQRLKVTDEATGQAYLTPLPYLVVHLPVRRQIQTLENKVSIPEDNKHIDEMTDQPTGVSKGSSLSFPEILVIYSQGNERGIVEFIKYRGGDLKGMRAMENMLVQTGHASMDQLDTMGTEVKSTQTLSILMKGMHLDNNFSGYTHDIK